MLIPHLKYIESLIVAKKPLDKVVEGIEDYDLHVPEEALPLILDTLRSERPDYFDGKNPEPLDPQWVRSLEIEEMVCYLTNFSFPEKLNSPKKAFQLLNDPLMYRLITSMALGRITDEDIELIVNGKFNMEYEAEDIHLFLKYFFNVREWTLKDRQNYVKMINEPQLLKFYKMALKGDKDYLLWKLGAAPEKDFSLMLKDMVHDSYYNFKEQSKIRPDLAQKWGTLAIKLTDKIDKLETTKEKSSAEFLENFEFKIKSNIEVSSKDKHVHLSDLQPDEFKKKQQNKSENLED